MADRTRRSGGKRGLVERLIGGRRGEAPRFPGTPTILTGAEAVLHTAGLACDAVVGPASEIASPRVGGAALAPRNAFGTELVLRTDEDTRDVLATACGLAATGRRTLALLAAGDYSGVAGLMRSAVERRLPLVVHAWIGETTPGAIDAFEGSGAIVVLARNAQAAVDLTLIVQQVGEATLTPGVVLVESAETAEALQDVCLPDAALVRELPGAPGDTIDCPTPAQAILFGPRRRRLPRWFDGDRAVVSGATLTGEDRQTAAAGRAAFFDAHVVEFLTETVERFEALTGRAWPALEPVRPPRTHAVVAYGAAVELARGVTSRHVAKGGPGSGVVGVTWLHPFPRDELRSSLDGIPVVSVVERSAGEASTALFREVDRALPRPGPARVSAIYGRLDASRMQAVLGNVESGRPLRERLRLTLPGTPGNPDHPRREALLQRLRRDYPELDAAPSGPQTRLPLPDGARSVCAVVRAERRPGDALRGIASAFGRSAAPPAKPAAHARGRTRRCADLLWRIDAIFSEEPLDDPGDTPAATLVLFDSVGTMRRHGGPIDTVDRATVLVANSADTAELWAAIPTSWRRAIRERELSLFAVSGDLDEAIAAAAQLGAGGQTLDSESGAAQPVAWADLADPVESEAPAELPLVVKRFGTTGETYGNVARFWGEYAEPAAAAGSAPGASGDAAPDPFIALGAVPPCTATFRDRTAERERLPLLDPAMCTGCGECWSSCPDSAIAPVALDIGALLDAAAPRPVPGAEPLSAAARKLARSHGRLAARIGTELKKRGDRKLTHEVVHDAWEWLTAKLNPGDDERAALDAAFEETLERMNPERFAVTDAFFLDAEREEKGSGTLLMLGFNPQSCQACGGCARNCPDEAIRMVPQEPEALGIMRDGWRGWEEMPDTAGTTIARAAEHPRVGRLAAVLLSRHCLFSLAGGDDAEPGSGQRMALRQVAAVTEYHMQQRLLEWAKQLAVLETELRAEIHEGIVGSVEVDDLDRLDEALASADGGVATSDVVARAAGDVAGVVDADRLRRLVAATKQVATLRERIAEGPQGLGRSRFGIVLAGRELAGWAARFPHNPFSVPVATDTTGDGAGLARGLLDGVMTRHVDDLRSVRRARLLLEAPNDLSSRLAALESLSWDELTREERASCPQLLLAIERNGLRGIDRLLSGALPLRVLLLDERTLDAGEVDPLPAALACRRAFVLSTSVAHSDHLFGGLDALLGFDGPALIHVHAPSPRRHGFGTEMTRERARRAVECRVHPLLRYDPTAEDSFGLCIDLAGNPQPDADWMVEDGQPLTPLSWARGESRFAGAFVAGVDGAEEQAAHARTNAITPDERAAQWRTLQELAGVRSPFTERVYQRAREETAEAHGAELAALRAGFEARLEEQERTQTASQVQRLRERLLQLAGYPPRPQRRQDRS